MPQWWQDLPFSHQNVGAVTSLYLKWRTRKCNHGWFAKDDRLCSDTLFGQLIECNQLTVISPFHVNMCGNRETYKTSWWSVLEGKGKAQKAHLRPIPLRWGAQLSRPRTVYWKTFWYGRCLEGKRRLKHTGSSPFQRRFCDGASGSRCLFAFPNSIDHYCFLQD